MESLPKGSEKVNDDPKQVDRGEFSNSRKWKVPSWLRLPASQKAKIFGAVLLLLITFATTAIKHFSREPKQDNAVSLSLYERACKSCIAKDTNNGLKWFRKAMREEATSKVERERMLKRALNDPDLTSIWREILEEFSEVP